MLAPLFLLLINSVVFNYRSGQMLQINVKLTSKMWFMPETIALPNLITLI